MGVERSEKVDVEKPGDRHLSSAVRPASVAGK